MNIKISIFIASTLLILSSCQDVVDLKVPDGDIQLVVDGWFTDQEGEKQVLLSTTANYFDQTQPPAVGNALVVLYDDYGAVDTLEEKTPGQYVTDSQGVAGRTYHIYIRTPEGEEYESNPETLIEVPEITAIHSEFKEESVFEEEGYYVSIDTYEPEGIGNYYRWKQYRNGEFMNNPLDLIYASDEFVDGNPILGFEINTEPLELGDQYLVQQLSISKEAYDFFTQLQTQTAFVGFLFDSPPAALNGNIRPVEAGGKKALGYFGVSAVAEKEIVIE